MAVSAPSCIGRHAARGEKGHEPALNVPMNRAVVVESDIPFAELSIANPGIADISSLSDRTIYVLGKSPGLTTLTLLDAGGQLITNVDVRVAADVSEFKERLRQILPGEKIEVRTANDGIVLSGIVSSTQRLQRALDLAERYAPERVSNLMSVGGIQQVMMKVRFAEMQRNVSKSLGSSLALNGGHWRHWDQRRYRHYQYIGRRCRFAWRATSPPPTRTQARSCLALTPGPPRWASCWKRLKQKALCGSWPNRTLLPCRGKRPNSLPVVNIPCPSHRRRPISVEVQTFRC